MTTAELLALCAFTFLSLVNIVVSWKRDSDIVRLHEWVYDLEQKVRELERKEENK